MRISRPKYSELTPQERRQNIAKSYANTYQRRGKLIPEPCADCGSKLNIHKHHEDYSRPLDVIWLCRPCHTKRHKQEDATFFS